MADRSAVLGLLALVLATAACASGTRGPEASVATMPATGAPLSTDAEPDPARLYATAFTDLCRNRCRAIDTVYVVDPRGSLGRDVRAAIREGDGPTPFFVESIDPFVDSEGFNANNRWGFSFSAQRRVAPDVYTLDAFRWTSRFDVVGEQLVYRWTGSAWIPIDPAEVGVTVTTAVP